MEATTKISNTSLHDSHHPGRFYYTLVVLVMLSATWLRFDGITSVGIRYQDEAWYVSDAQLWHRCAQVLADGPAWAALLHRDKAAYQQRMDEIGIDFSARYQKPSQGFTLPAAAIMFLSGEGPVALFLLNALFGTFVVWLVYALCRNLFNPAVALIASALIAVSPYHLVYSRSALAHTTAGSAVLLGMYLWVLGRKRDWSTRRTFMLSGLACGFAATCHYSIAYFAGIPLFMELFVNRSRHQASTPAHHSAYSLWFRATGWMCLGFAIPFLAIESVFLSARIAATVSDSYLPLQTFFQGIALHAKFLVSGGTVGDRIIHTDVAWAMAQYFTHWHGLLALCLAMLGMGGLLMKRSPSSIAGWIVLASILMLLLQSHPIARGLNSALPFIAICIAVTIYQLSQLWVRLSSKMAYASIFTLLCLVLSPAIQHSWQLLHKSSDLAQACQYLKKEESAKVIVPNYRRYWIHLEHSSHILIDAQTWVRALTPEQTIQRWLEDGIKWVTIDPQFWHSSPGVNDIDWWIRLDQLLNQRFLKAKEYQHLRNYRWEFLAEGSWGPFRLQAMDKFDGGSIRVYDLQQKSSSYHDRNTVVINEVADHTDY